MASEIERLINMLGDRTPWPQERIRLAHSIVALARKEGAEQAKTDIWKAQLYGYRVQLYPLPHDEREGLRVETDVDGVAYTLVPSSVLSPKVKP